MESRRILIVANQTAGGHHLKQVIQKRLEQGPAVFTLLVPSTAPPEVVWTEGQAYAAAEERMREALEGLREVGAEVEGVVGDQRPIHAITDVLVENPHDEIIVSTLPVGISRWLKQDLPHRVERVFKLPTTHVVAEPAKNA
jgi:hypothetical protein